jgi:transposase
MVSHKIRLVPLRSQEDVFRRACGTARFAYNWALAQWQCEYRAGGKPNETVLRKRLNAIKATEFPWMYEVPKTVIQHAIKNLGVAYKNFFDDLAKAKRGFIEAKRIRRPRLKKKLCSVCDVKNETLTLSERIWTCLSCGTTHDRDVNAAVNVARYPESSPGAACRADGSGGGTISP